MSALTSTAKLDRKIGGWRHVDWLRLGFAHRRGHGATESVAAGFFVEQCRMADLPYRFFRGSRRHQSDARRPGPSPRQQPGGCKQPTYFIADLANNTILKPWVVERMKKDNAEVLAGKIGFTANSSCMPGGVPGFHLFGFQPLYFVQTPREVVLVYSSDEQVRHVYLDVPHSANPKPSWYGDSVGHYEGDTLVVDTIGMNDKTFIDAYRTPHTEKLHVVERFRMVDGGKAMQVDIALDDPDAFNAPWQLTQRYDRVQQPFAERICAENNEHLFNYRIPQTTNADF
jgi:hypothetical protein